ncbi:MAG: hypothetical protein SFV22_13130 [Saprospiraceae bacterium]|nr:hypothetical protein [Saprospiraceae bacterium]
MFQKLPFLLLSLIAFNTAQPSGKIYLRNPSFEDTPGSGKSPKGWYSGYKGSTPDIMPGAWEIMFPPQEGKTCVGLIVREDGTREDISQALAEPLKAGQCYKFTIYLAHASKYVGYNKPTRLRIFGCAEKGGACELLDTSPLIDHSDWRSYKFEITPSSNVTQLLFEAYYAPGVLFKYKGNLLLDNCSPLEKCERA